MRRAIVPAAVAALLLAVAACGSDDDPVPEEGAVTTTSGSALPAVTGGLDEKPTISIPDSAPPAELQVQVLSEGDGPPVEAGDMLTAHYVGQLWRDGSQFDASWDRNEPATFPVGTGNLIAAWDEGLVGVPYGSRVLIVAPPDKGYGSSGNPAAGIRGDDTLVFVVDLVEKAG